MCITSVTFKISPFSATPASDTSSQWRCIDFLLAQLMVSLSVCCIPFFLPPWSLPLMCWKQLQHAVNSYDKQTMQKGLHNILFEFSLLSGSILNWLIHKFDRCCCLIFFLCCCVCLPFLFGNKSSKQYLVSAFKKNWHLNLICWKESGVRERNVANWSEDRSTIYI